MIYLYYISFNLIFHELHVIPPSVLPLSSLLRDLSSMNMLMYKEEEQGRKGVREEEHGSLLVALLQSHPLHSLSSPPLHTQLSLLCSLSRLPPPTGTFIFPPQSLLLPQIRRCH